MSSIGGVGGSSMMMMESMRPMRRPDPTQMAENLVSKIDTSGEGSIQKAELQSAFASLSSSSGSSEASSTSSTDALFSRLDGDGDGSITQAELSEAAKKLADEMEGQMLSLRMGGDLQGPGGTGGMGGAMAGMPPRPPGAADDAGFTEEELTSQLSEIGSSDSERSELISSIVESFDEADGDGDGKVSFREAMAFDQASSSTSSSSTDSDSTASAAATQDAALMRQLVQLAHAYRFDTGSSDTLATALSLSA